MALRAALPRRWGHPVVALLLICGLSGAAGCGDDESSSQAAAPAAATTPAASTPPATSDPSAASPGASGSSGSSKDAFDLQGVKATAALFKGIPQSGTTLGDPKAPVIVEYVDLQCPFCALHERDHAADIIDKLVRPGKAQLFVVPLAFLGPDSKTAQTVFLRLAKRNAAFPFLHLMYLNQGQENSGYVTPAYLESILAATGDAQPGDASPARDADITKLATTFDALGKAAFTRAAQAGAPAGTPYFMVGAPGQDATTLTPVVAKRGKVTVDVLERALGRLPKSGTSS